MKNALIFVGREFLIDDGFIDYVKREAQRRLLFLNALRFLSERNKDLFLEVSKAHEEYDNLLIVTSPTSFATVSKIVATLFSDTLVAKEEILLPSKAIQYTHNSFLIGEDHKINVIKAHPTEKLPRLFFDSPIETINLYITDLQPEEIRQILQPIAKRTEVDFILTPLTQELYKVCALNRPYGNIAQFAQEAKDRIPKLIVAHNIFEYLIDRFSSLGRHITFAESCTGGLLASMLTKVPGSSTIFEGSLVTYANEIKEAWLGVKKETLQTFGAVSEETVEEMLRGALKVTRANYAIAISGIAGPGGATPTKPVGTVVVGCRSDKQEIIRTKHFKGDRNYIQYQAALYGIKLLLEIASEDLL